MITRIFALGEEKSLQEKALRLGKFLNKGEGLIEINPFTRIKKTSFTPLNQKDLTKLFFIGSSAGKRFGDFTGLDLANALAAELWPSVDRMLVHDLYFIDLEGGFTQDDSVLMQEFANELGRKYFSRVTFHVLAFNQVLNDKTGAVLEALRYTYKPTESAAAREKRTGVSSRLSAVTSLMQSMKKREERNTNSSVPRPNGRDCGRHSNSPVASASRQAPEWISGINDIPRELIERTVDLVSLLEREITQLQDKASASCFSYFIRYELTTKTKKQTCLLDLLRAQSLEQLQQKARTWAEDKRVLRGWINTSIQSWRQSRTLDLLEDILHDPYDLSSTREYHL